ncbi:MAG TPA: FKBP-type peptidyl-prolyl cis-trans isomerase [Rhodopirellula baltica]|uniref:Peptidyl-prolyl cis-trans isomerase n=1 Tax=Rhodopirellula baltica (strain DSM 10527 / NCIMB 13988 / SH1) TaxID=243090 RepID=Q7UXJ9_RHOBA|nr:FKBP-type peptidyl-prolyl cis-trans isomerase [Rhodopirellula baltica]CAD72007.1 probable peptidyl-prolyl cis-trans isomerase, FkbP-type [Rhodopirellula baltica SH 1]HBE66403.1 FKBP-type peptidyl-prolyl cis-trans isomerase [Rhodopirellula baltica]
MKPPRSLKILDHEIGSGRPCVPGDLATCNCVCSRRKGDMLFASDADTPYQIRVGGRDCHAGIEYGLLGMRIGGRRTVIVPPNLTYDERKRYPDLPADALLVYELELLDLPGKWDPEMERRLAARGSSNWNVQDCGEPDDAQELSS